MRVVAAHTMQEIDREAIDTYGIPGIQLMENAGRSCVEEIIAEFGLSGSCVVVAGKGNNGGDGFVIARLLAQKGWRVSVIVVADREAIAGDAAQNLDRLPGSIISFCTNEGQLSAPFMAVVFQADVIVDALLGTGLNSDVSGIYREAIDLINAAGRPVVSVDVPSGVHGTTGRVLGAAIRADITVTFAFAKLGNILYPGAELTGRLLVADIGIPAQLMDTASGYEFLTANAMRHLVRRRNRIAHKGHFGHCLIVAGSTGKTGAAVLTANSAVRAGSGLVTLAVAESIHNIAEQKTTEAMTCPLADFGSGYLTSSSFSAIEKLLDGKDVLAVGPGLGCHAETFGLVRDLVVNVSQPLVIDADGLNALAEDVDVLKRKKATQVVLTPHPGEMARLFGVAISDVEERRISVAQEFAKSYGVHLVLKGARTIIASPSGIAAINGSGNPGMASGGMGDVLSGVIASLLGQGYEAWDACRLGVFLHGYAADLVASEKGEIGMTASDVVEKIPFAYNELLKK